MITYYCDIERDIYDINQRVDRVFTTADRMSLDKGDLPLQPPRQRERGGIEGKWAALSDERESLREERDQLKTENERLRAEKAAADAMKEFGLGMNEEEGEVMDALQFAYNRIRSEWKLAANIHQLTIGLHMIRSFVIQHMLHRLAPDRWPSWWEEKPELKEEIDEGD